MFKHLNLKENLPDTRFLKLLLKLSIPVTLQSLIASLINFIDVLMLGQLGEVPVAAVGISNQMVFLLMLMSLGLSTGNSVHTAQFWGSRDVLSIKKTAWLTWFSVLFLGISFLIAGTFFSGVFLSFYTNDPDVTHHASDYLSIVAWSFPFVSLTFAHGNLLKSVRMVNLPFIASFISLILNAVLNYLLIFGNYGFPEMGVQGAALATLTARIIEFIFLIAATQYLKSPLSISFQALKEIKKDFVFRILKTSAPVFLNETFWSLGFTTYQMIYSRIGTSSIAAVQITMSIERLFFATFVGIAIAGGVIVGNSIGANEIKEAGNLSAKSLSASLFFSLITSTVIFLCRPLVPLFFQVSPEVLQITGNLLMIYSGIILFKAWNVLFIVGIFRSGGDTRYCMFLEIFSMWFYGVPLALLSAFVFRLPVEWIYLIVGTEELMKCLVAFHRYRSKKWIHQLSKPVVTETGYANPIPSEEII